MQTVPLAMPASVFIGEGLLLYLDRPVIDRLFGVLRIVEPHSIEPEVPAGGALLVIATPVRS
jgi:hypothetical protein